MKRARVVISLSEVVEVRPLRRELYFSLKNPLQKYRKRGKSVFFDPLFREKIQNEFL